MEATTPHVLALAASIIASYCVTVIIYRKFFHPLAKFPGPPLAAVSSIVLWYLNRKGFPEHDFEHWHKKYNSKVIRIAPHELHIADAESYKKIYNQHSPPKYDVFYDGFLAPSSLFGEWDIAKHKERRKLMNPLFSRSSIIGFQPLVLERLALISQKILERCTSGPINVVDAYRCLTIDIISELLFGKTLDLTGQSPPSFRADYLRIFDIAVEAQPRIYNNPLKRHIWPKIPFWITGLFDETIRDTIGLIKYSVMCLDIHKNRISAPRFPVLFDKLQDLPDQVQISEAMSTLIAGSDTTAFTLSFASYAISKAPAIRARLEKELKDNIADPDQMPSLGELERLPYLAACVKESLRLAMPAPGRLPRVLPASGPPLVIDGQVIPPGSVIGYSAYSVHYDESVWGTNARQFMPERWMGDDAKHLENYLVTFSKGNRACIGINLAQAEIYTVLAHLFRKFDMELLTDKLTTRDVFVQALPEEGVQVIFKPKST
ncbi:hypothetical protein SLS56_007362 [Neofusicoccum ribis]|uniref:Cytochrome P450 n=1 Tax=Neofusicoccum ribis TaxID=45134 RepID=A0ABR3SN54_9PEZI